MTKTGGAEHILYVGDSDRLPLYFKELLYVGEVDDPYFRENGVPIHFGSHFTEKLYADWEEEWMNSKGRVTRDLK